MVNSKIHAKQPMIISGVWYRPQLGTWYPRWPETHFKHILLAQKRTRSTPSDQKCMPWGEERLFQAPTIARTGWHQCLVSPHSARAFSQSQMPQTRLHDMKPLHHSPALLFWRSMQRSSLIHCPCRFRPCFCSCMGFEMFAF